jgi:hypothetical protein
MTRRSWPGRGAVAPPPRSCERLSLASRNGSPGAADALPGEFDLLALIDALARHEVEYVIVGGIAAMHHGAIRQTDDLDVCPRWSRDNLDRLAEALCELRAELAVAPGETVPVPVIDGVLLGRMEVGTWQTWAGRFDVLRGIPKTATTRADFEELSARAVTSDVSGRAVRVADLEDVVRSKRIAGRPKDHEALPELDELRAADIGDPSQATDRSPPPRQELPQPSPPTPQSDRPPSAQ